jgi:hypothetical protein
MCPWIGGEWEKLFEYAGWSQADVKGKLIKWMKTFALKAFQSSDASIESDQVAEADEESVQAEIDIDDSIEDENIEIDSEDETIKIDPTPISKDLGGELALRIGERCLYFLLSEEAHTHFAGRVLMHQCAQRHRRHVFRTKAYCSRIREMNGMLSFDYTSSLFFLEGYGIRVDLHTLTSVQN